MVCIDGHYDPDWTGFCIDCGHCSMDPCVYVGGFCINCGEENYEC